jgi:hypothetical protein
MIIIHSLCSRGPRFDVLTAVGCNVIEFGDSLTIWRKCRLHNQRARVSQARNSRGRREGFTSVSVIFSLGLVLDPASGDVFLRTAWC